MDGSRMAQWVDFSISYAPMVASDLLRLIITIASSEGMSIIFIDASNTFQKNVISDPKKRVYISLPTLGGASHYILDFCISCDTTSYLLFVSSIEVQYHFLKF